MLLVLCNTWPEAQEAFKLFIEYLKYTNLLVEIREINRFALSVLTDDDIQYLFVDERYYPRMLRQLKADTIYEEDFMEEIYEFFDERT